MTTSAVFGVDVASEFFDVAHHGCSDVQQHTNQPKAIKAWLKTLPVGAVIALEATGTYHLTIADLAHAAGMTVYVVNPQDIAHYRRGVGTRAKTDRVDALLIARYAAREHADLHPYVPASDSHRRVMRLLHRRAQLVKVQTALRLSAAEMTDLQTATLAIVKQIKNLLARIDRQMLALVRQEAETHTHIQRLQAIDGVGALTATALTLSYQRHPFAGVDAFVAYLGMDPRPRESGKSQGQRRLSKRGDGELRRLLYCAAQSATRTPLWQPYYQEQRSKGRFHVEAIMILARRLVKTAFALLSKGTEFNPDLVKKPCLTP